MPEHAKPYERLGFPATWLMIDLRKESVKIGLDGIAADPGRWDVVNEMPVYRDILAMAYYLAGDREATRVTAGQVVADAQEAFFGTWRRDKRILPAHAEGFEWWRQNLRWVSAFLAATMWGSCLGRWKEVQQLAQYPQADCPADESPQHKAFYLGVARYLRRDDPAEALAEAGRGKQKGLAILSRAVAALGEGKAGDAEGAIVEYLRHFRKREFSRRSLDGVVTQAGTLVVNLARRAGVGVALSAELADHVIAVG